MEFFRGLKFALLFSAFIYGAFYSVYKVGLSIGYEDGKAFQQYVNNEKLQQCNKLIAGIQK